VADHGEVLQDLDQVLMAELCGSTGTVGQFGQADFAFCHPAVPPCKHQP